MTNHAVKLTELALRDGHQSLLATRMRLDDMLPIAAKLDEVGYWSIESWGGATFDSCIRFLGEDPWVRLRELKKAMPKTRQQMLLRGQNLLGYRHYADDLVCSFVERAYANGIEVFRVFDALNDSRNLKTSMDAVNKCGGHAQGTLSYTHSPYHTQEYWLNLAKELQDMGANSIAIKDMSGLIKPAEAFDLIRALKQQLDIPVHLHCHATTGLSTPTFYKAVEAGVDVLDTAISPLSQTYSHSATETIVAMLEGTEWDTGLDMSLLEEIALYFRKIRKKYAAYEGSLQGIDSRILVAQVPGGMLTNLENQLKEQNALDRFDDVIEEIPRVRKDLGYIPLVTPTSQIVGTQAVLNVLADGRYDTLSRETQSLIRGEYGKTPAAIDANLSKRVLGDEKAITHRPADDLQPECAKQREKLLSLAKEHHFETAENTEEDMLIYALFPQPGLHFFKNRNNPNAFESMADISSENKETTSEKSTADDSGSYQVNVDGNWFQVEVHSGEATDIPKQNLVTAKPLTPPNNSNAGSTISSPMAGTIVDIKVNAGDQVSDGETLFILEAMKMETEIKATQSGSVSAPTIALGDQVTSGQPLINIS